MSSRMMQKGNKKIPGRLQNNVLVRIRYYIGFHQRKGCIEAIAVFHSSASSGGNYEREPSNTVFFTQLGVYVVVAISVKVNFHIIIDLLFRDVSCPNK